MKSKCPAIMSKFIINLKQPKYYEIDEDLIENLRVCLENNQEGKEFANALRGGVDRDRLASMAQKEQDEEQIYQDYGSDSGDEMPAPQHDPNGTEQFGTAALDDLLAGGDIPQ